MATTPVGIPIRQAANPNVAKNNLLGPAAAAATTTAQVLVAPCAGDVTSVLVTPRTIVAQDTPDPTVFRLMDGATVVATVQGNVAAAMAAGTVVSIPITAANAAFAQGDQLVFEIVNGGAGAQNLSATTFDVQINWQPS
jgi:hypothetical protein